MLYLSYIEWLIGNYQKLVTFPSHVTLPTSWEFETSYIMPCYWNLYELYNTKGIPLCYDRKRSPSALHQLRTLWINGLAAFQWALITLITKVPCKTKGRVEGRPLQENSHSHSSSQRAAFLASSRSWYHLALWLEDFPPSLAGFNS